MPLLYFIIGHLNSSTQFGKDQYFQITVFEKYPFINFVNLFIVNFFNNSVRIYNTATSLVHSFLQEHWVLFRDSYGISWNNYILYPGFYFFLIHIAIHFVFFKIIILFYFNFNF